MPLARIIVGGIRSLFILTFNRHESLPFLYKCDQVCASQFIEKGKILTLRRENKEAE